LLGIPKQGVRGVDREEAWPVILQALKEDIGGGDVTTARTIPSDRWLAGEFLVKAPGVIAGLRVVGWVFEALNGSIEYRALGTDGDPVQPGDVVALVRGKGGSVLTGERVALNFLQRMSGIATMTRRYVDAVAGTGAVILDTRKTVPGLRMLDKWAVRLGGGQNHRMGLYDMVLIKDNHIRAAGGISAAVASVRQDCELLIEVEAETLDQFEEALALDVDRIMLDNMGTQQLQEAVKRAGGLVELEASGGITIDNVAEVARTGVDYISVGALTHSVAALDVSLEIELE
jgi:nicotinate-nucleotide pyrophosphorylase (carboxylating)